MASTKKPTAKKAPPARKAAPTKKRAAAKKAPAQRKAQPTKKVNTPATESMPLRVRLFAEEFIKDENATQAAIRAGYSEHTAKQQGSRLLTRVDVKQLVEQARAAQVAKVQEETGITLARTLREIAKGAFHDPRKFFDAAGNLKPVAELDEDTAAALAGFEVTEEFGPAGTSTELEPQPHGGGLKRQHRGIVGWTKKIKLADRKGYLDMLMKHLGGYKKDNEQGGEAAANALSLLLAQMRRSALPVVANPDE